MAIPVACLPSRRFLPVSRPRVLRLRPRRRRREEGARLPDKWDRSAERRERERGGIGTLLESGEGACRLGLLLSQGVCCRTKLVEKGRRSSLRYVLQVMVQFKVGLGRTCSLCGVRPCHDYNGSLRTAAPKHLAPASALCTGLRNGPEHGCGG